MRGPLTAAPSLLRVARRLRGLGLATGLAAVASCSDGVDGTEVVWIDRPPATARVDQPVSARFEVETGGALHVAILRGCEGDVPDCGLEVFDAEGFADLAAGPELTASFTPRTPGRWSAAVYVHVDDDPHLSEVVPIDVAP